MLQIHANTVTDLIALLPIVAQVKGQISLEGLGAMEFHWKLFNGYMQLEKTEDFVEDQ